MTHRQAISRLLSQYLKPTTPYSQTGLHNLMQYKDEEQGMKGNLEFLFPDGKREKIKVRCGN